MPAFDVTPAAEDAVPTGRASRAANTVGGAIRILLAEDDILLGATIAEFLVADGFTVIAMPDGQAALEAALADIDGFDILLTDLRMPRLDGTSLLLALRARRPGLPVVVMSGNVPSNWREMMMRELNGLRQPKLITKPMRLDDLRAALQDECASVQG